MNWGILPSVVWLIAVSFLGFNSLRSLNTVLGWPVLSPNVAVAAARRTCRRTFRFSYCQRAFEPRRALTQARCGAQAMVRGKKGAGVGKSAWGVEIAKIVRCFCGVHKAGKLAGFACCALGVRFTNALSSFLSLSFSSTFPLFSLSLLRESRASWHTRKHRQRIDQVPQRSFAGTHLVHHTRTQRLVGAGQLVEQNHAPHLAVACYCGCCCCCC